MNELLKGKPVADAIVEALKNDTTVLESKDIIPCLALIRVGEKSDDIAYERGIVKRCDDIGIKTKKVELAENITQEAFLSALKEVNEDSLVHGILIFRPLPKQLDEKVIEVSIAPGKDVDCLHPENTAKLLTGDESGFVPCTPMAVMEIFKHYQIPLEGKNAVVLGRSMVVGKPAALLLLQENATVTVAHSRTKELEKITAGADILIAAIGRSEFVREAHIKEGAVVADVGINVDEEGNMTGDVHQDEAKSKAGAFTPVPGGVGSVTTAVLAKQVIKACKMQHK
ncbi:bifunctional 5,10-methylenetetrahydrofolate dehydrogenase/5,10-methenyltetrahydrofolate cyclohydrolase [Tindallia californiensis]|uniref:Bifunctional protein FolD n=1 Tax=Tindallia californiensis TaxID=159292 RepID=A0A1H3LKT1_9FIRM|nr:bifunctional 5,10-methylenetetrahydrofolate dehydrogenase/5,10-methenyltetrahydrofolate cyclohydrolase [Tindallia californiensis]SDY64749.1 methenyltetrahydrofolate cyclohydrolase /5,10-methylenetetrahydrofolate dehydrogenase (NADP+) [Tindallia californiensis]